MELKHPRLSNNGRSSFSPIINREKKKVFQNCLHGWHTTLKERFVTIMLYWIDRKEFENLDRRSSLNITNFNQKFVSMQDY